MSSVLVLFYSNFSILMIEYKYNLNFKSNNMINNYKELATNENKKKLLDIFISGIRAGDPAKMIRSEFRFNKNVNSLTIHNKNFNLFSGRIFVVGGGKAGGRMAEVLEDVLGEKEITAGVINDVDVVEKYSKMRLIKNYYDRFVSFIKCFVLGINCDWRYKTRKIKIVRSGHPIPDRRGMKGVEMMMDLKNKYKINKKDTVICLISGGASALMPMPVDKVSLKDKQETTKLLLDSGANIKEVNIIRKHLSQIKGGRLAEHFYPARVISLIISDVPDNDISVIGSGPTVVDTTTFKDVEIILEKYKLKDRLPSRVRIYLDRGAKSQESETPKELTNVHNFLIGDNGIVLSEMAQKAKSFGLNPIIVSSDKDGDTESVAQEEVDKIERGRYDGYDVVIMGGETTIRLPEKHGSGGRNQHYAAVSMKNMPEDKNWTLLSVASDGSDFLPGVAGVLVDNSSLSKARKNNLDIDLYLKNYNTGYFFKKLGGHLLSVGNTGTNVGDIVIYLLK